MLGYSGVLKPGLLSRLSLAHQESFEAFFQCLGHSEQAQSSYFQSCCYLCPGRERRPLVIFSYIKEQDPLGTTKAFWFLFSLHMPEGSLGKESMLQWQRWHVERERKSRIRFQIH